MRRTNPNPIDGLTESLIDIVIVPCAALVFLTILVIQHFTSRRPT